MVAQNKGIRMKKYFRRIAALAIVVLVVSLVTGVATVHADETHDTRAELAKASPTSNCFILLSGEKDLNGDSIVLIDVCASSYSEGKALYDERLVMADGGAASTPMVRTQLMVWWEHTTGTSGYGNSTVIYGNSGPCDTSGYTVVPNAYWQNNMSAIVGNGVNTCNTLLVPSIPLNVSQVINSPVYSLGYFNDNVGRVKAYCANLSYCP